MRLCQSEYSQSDSFHLADNFCNDEYFGHVYDFFGSIGLYPEMVSPTPTQEA